MLVKMYFIKHIAPFQIVTLMAKYYVVPCVLFCYIDVLLVIQESQ